MSHLLDPDEELEIREELLEDDEEDDRELDVDDDDLWDSE